MTLTTEQINDMAHMIGLSNSRKPYRNYYCAGRDRITHLDDLCIKGLAIMQFRGKELGQWYYHLTSDGLKFILDNRSLFDFDGRIKKLETLINKCN
jgi:hypothetical protein